MFRLRSVGATLPSTLPRIGKRWSGGHAIDPRNVTVVTPYEEEVLKISQRVRENPQVRPSSQARTDKLLWKRNIAQHGKEKHDNFDNTRPSRLTERGALREATRCLRCADAPCQKSCPTSIDVKAFISSIANKNYFEAARLIMSDNPVGLTCGMVCPTSDLCVGSCNLAAVEEGPINIHGLQEFAVDRFFDMDIPQTPGPDGHMAGSAADAKITLVGSGPASISCGSFLGRMGYKNVTILEKNLFPGGLSATEIPGFRLPMQAVYREVKFMEDLGVKIQYGRALGKDLTIKKLQEDGNEAVFVGIGLPEAKIDRKVFDPSTKGFYTSKSFLPGVDKTKLCDPNCATGCGDERPYPKISGRAVVLGAGDTAFDCASTAFRCGASDVTMIFRQGFGQIRAVEDETELARKEHVEFLPFSITKEVLLNDEGHIRGLRMGKTKFDENRKLVETGDEYILDCDYVISAFGSELPDDLTDALHPLSLNQSSKFAHDPETMQSQDAPWLFVGGDCAGSTITVEAANDGKSAAWSMHKYLQEKYNGPNAEFGKGLPMVHTAVDDVDISIDMAGVHFPNPFGLASAPPCTSGSMIRRAFEQGWGFAVTKTFCLDKDLITNVSPRIIRGSASGNLYGPNQGAFMNIELITEKTLAYWTRVVEELRRDFPSHPLVASIMAAYTREDWHELVEKTLPSNPHVIELNLSCPHGMGERGMGQACGQNPEMVFNICKWVREAVGPDYPFFAKLTPSVTDIRHVAEQAVLGGATGVTAINTVSSLQHLNAKGEPWPAVGSEKLTTFGGMSGNAVRPMALKAISSIASSMDVPIMGTGGADSANASREMLHAGASVVQICSSIQNEDLSVIQDYISGMKFHLYSQSRPDLREWDGQTSLDAYESRSVLKDPSLPSFGLYELEKRKKREAMGNVVEYPAEKNGRPLQDAPVPTVKSEIGKGLKYVANFTDLSIEEQVVAQVNYDTCINCGRCYLACSDSAYQAIEFDEQTHLPEINDNCTGCAMCLSVCPVIDCITMQPRDGVFPDSPFEAHRGIEPEGEVVGTLAGQKDKRVSDYAPVKKKVKKTNLTVDASNIASKH